VINGDPARIDPARVLARAEAGDFDAIANEIAPAFDWFMDTDRVAALRLVAALRGYWQDSGRVDEGRALTERAVSATLVEGARDQGIARAIPRALLAASELAFRQGDQKATTKRAWDTIRAAILVEDRPTASLAYSCLALAAERDGDAGAVAQHAEKALEYADGDPAATGDALHWLGWAAYSAGDLDEAARRFARSLDHRRQHGSSVEVATDIAILGKVAMQRGDVPRSAALLGEALDVTRGIRSAYIVVNMLPLCAELAVRGRLVADAARLFGAGRAHEQTSGMLADPSPTLDEAIATARDRLGEARFAELLSEGTMLSADDALNLAAAVTRELRFGTD
jgi:tetratricopeptide (TPR) repeat protein